MRYTFIKYRSNRANTDEPREFEMVLIENVTDVMAAVRKITGPVATDLALNPHALFSTKRINGEVIRSEVQVLYDPVNMANSVFHNMSEGLRDKKKFIMNSKGGYQTLLDDMSSIGWVEVSREKRDKLIFKDLK